MSNETDYTHQLEGKLRAGDVQGTLDIIQQHLDAGTAPLALVDQGLIPAIRKVGELFEQGELFLPHLMRSAEAMKKGMGLLGPHIADEDKDRDTSKTVILGTVEGDIHDIGKNIVSLMLSASGFQVVDLGASVSVDRFLKEVTGQAAELLIVGLSSLLTTTMIQQRVLIQKLQEENLRHRVKVMVGGACVSSEWADEIGADGYGLSAQEAVKLAHQFTQDRT